MPFDPYYSPPKGWLPEAAGLTVNQLAAIGFVITTWAALESIYQHTLFVLVQSPDTLGQALTEDLGPDNRSKALKRLCSSWKLILSEDFTEQIGALDKLEHLNKWVDTNKAKRNQIAHWNWIREDDQHMFAFKYHLRPYNLTDNRPKGLRTTHDELFKFGGEISQKASEFLSLMPSLDKLPPWPHKSA